MAPDRVLTPQELLKIEVETDLLRKEAEKMGLEGLEVSLKSRKLEAEIKKEESQAIAYALELEKKLEAREEEKAQDKYHRVYVFDSAVGDKTVDVCIKQFQAWERIEREPIEATLRFNSPGGDIIAGMYLYDFLTGFKARGNRLITEAYGYAASMAGILLQAGDVRRVGPESYVLIHEASFNTGGKVGEVEDTVEFVHKVQNRILDIFAAGAARAKAQGTAPKALSRASFKRRWTRKDWWLTSDECLAFGIVDEVA